MFDLIYKSIFKASFPYRFLFNLSVKEKNSDFSLFVLVTLDAHMIKGGVQPKLMVVKA